MDARPSGDRNHRDEAGRAGPRGEGPGEGGPEFSLTVLGSDGSYPGPGGAGSGYLVLAGGFSTWLEAGPGTLANLQLHVPLERLDAVVISHSHADHRSDLESLHVALRYFKGRKGLPLYAPEELREVMREEHFDGTFDWRAICEGASAELGPARWTWSRTDHPVETLAARVDLDGRALGYSADTGPAWELGALGEGLTLGLVEASLPSDREGTLQHLSARQAGRTAAGAGARRLLLTHIAPPIDRTKARREAEEAFGSRVELARVGKTWRI